MSTIRLLVNSRLFLAIGLLLTVFFSPTGYASAQEQSLSGFIIEADQIVGNSMVSRLTVENGKPMIRFVYDSATIYGMKMTKEFKTSSGYVTLVITADRPIQATNMVVDTSALTVGGACLSIGETYPQLGIKDATILAHHMTAGSMNMSGLSLKTVSGRSGVSRPETNKLIQELASKSGANLLNEIKRLMDAKAPLTCDVEESQPGDPLLNLPVEEVENLVEDIKDIITLSPDLDPFEIIDEVRDLLDIPDTDLDHDLVEIINDIRNNPLDAAKHIKTLLQRLLEDPIGETTKLVTGTGKLINESVSKPDETAKKVSTIVTGIGNKVINPTNPAESPVNQSDDSDNSEGASEPATTEPDANPKTPTITPAPEPPKMDEATKAALAKLVELNKKLDEELKKATDGFLDPPKTVVDDLKELNRKVDALLEQTAGQLKLPTSTITEINHASDEFNSLLKLIERLLLNPIQSVGGGGILKN